MIPLLLSVLAIGAAVEPAPHPGDAFQWRQKIRGADEVETIYRIQIPNEVFDGCRQFPADLRLFDANGEQWPCFVWVPQPRIRSRTISTLREGEERSPGGALDIRLKLIGSAMSTQSPRHNRVTLLAGGDFSLRKVEVYGRAAPDSPEALLGNGLIIAIEGDARVSNRVVSYPVSSLPYVRIRVYPDARREGDAPEIQHVHIGHHSEGDVEWVAHLLKEVSREDNEEEGMDSLVFDSGARNVPLAELRLEIPGMNFLRAVTVSGRNTETNQWQWITDSVVYRIGDVESTVIPVKRSAHRFVKVDIHRKEEPSLPVSGVRAMAYPHFLLFEAQRGLEPALYFGADDVGAPRLELARRKGELAAPDAPEPKLGKRRPIVLGEPEDHIWRWVVISVVGCMVGGLGMYVVVRKLKRGARGRSRWKPR